MSQAIDDMYAYTLLTDCVVQQILMSPDDSLKQVSIVVVMFNYHCCGLPIPQAQRDGTVFYCII